MQALFSDHDLAEFLNNSKINMVRETESCEHDYLLSVSIDDYCEYLISKYRVKTPILFEDKIYILSQKEIRKNGSTVPTIYNASMLTGDVLITIAIPFEGNSTLFNCRPTTITNPPIGIIKRKNEIHLQCRSEAKDPEVFKQNIENHIDLIKKYLKWMNNDNEKHNQWIKDNVRKQVSTRKNRALEIQGYVNSLNIPILRSKDLPASFAIPIKRKKIMITKPKVTSEPFKPEPSLEEQEYEYILETLSHMSIAMERSPKTFSKLGENAIRDFFTIILNSHYKGQVTGETFNVEGKTDILLRAEGKNAFIAECKIWRGPKSLTSSIDQVLSYSSWRDTKTAVLLFSKNREFSNILEKIDGIVQSHNNFKRKHNLKNRVLKIETVFSYIFHQSVDINRELVLTVMCFNIP